MFGVGAVGRHDCILSPWHSLGFSGTFTGLYTKLFTSASVNVFMGLNHSLLPEEILSSPLLFGQPFLPSTQPFKLK